jgi:hypothetical protein
MLMFAETILTFIVEAIVAGPMALALSPQERDEVDAMHHLLVLARPVARHHLQLFGIPLVQGSVVYDEHPTPFVNMGFHLGPPTLPHPAAGGAASG